MSSGQRLKTSTTTAVSLSPSCFAHLDNRRQSGLPASIDSEIEREDKESEAPPKFFSFTHAPRLSIKQALPLPGHISLSMRVAPGMVSWGMQTYALIVGNFLAGKVNRPPGLWKVS